MYKVLVVDDEPFMLEGWKTMVDWNSCGYELCGTATDGEEALASIRACEPDLVVTDIQMPVLDGLGLIRILKEEMQLNMKIVIVSGYPEFSYARQALRYQVDHYVLKPLVTEEIHRLLLELAGPLEELRRTSAIAQKEQTAAAASAIVALLKNGGAGAVRSAERLLGADEGTRCSLLIAESAAGPDGGVFATAGSVQPRLRKLADAGIGGASRTWHFEEAPGRAGLLVLDDGRSGERFDVRLAEAAATMAADLGDLAVYCSGSARGLASVPELYRQAMEARGLARLGPHRGLHLYRERAADGDYRLEEITACAEALLRLIDEGNPEGAGRSVDGLLQRLAREGAREGWVEAAARRIRGELLRRYADPDDDAAPWTGDTLKRLCVRAAERRARAAEPERAHGSGSAVAEAIEYLKLHYREKIQLQELAERFRLNPVYFGQQFKRETGSCFNDYVHGLRIEEARKLLRRTDMKMSDIAATLGYHDAQYFTDKFKALTGELPSSYKNKRRGERRAEQSPSFP
ncbi:response regulator [Cohnella zeiphila]|uniref:Response regulator n=1 Tax=Cohnella zeiphila TaxID=2761120 RepID=A0A7X0SJ41_9BACL|nr:response regulator [Cohnella zeiphila]MBB6730921.1 response regulator [Cohnella zeiphila]